MALNVTALLQGAAAVANHPITKGGSLAALISGGLYAATFAGVVIPTWAFSVGPLAGLIFYALLPTKEEIAIDKAAADVVSIVSTIPKTYSTPMDFPQGTNGSTAAISSPVAENNINKVQ